MLCYVIAYITTYTHMFQFCYVRNREKKRTL